MRVALYLLQDSVAVELGHQNIEQQKVEAPASQQVERFGPVLGEYDGMAVLLEPAAEQEPVDPVVVRDQDRARCARGAGHETGSDRSEARVSAIVRYSCPIRSTSRETPSRWPSLARCSTVRQR